MVLALVVGDLHVPDRAAGIPEAFRKMFTPGRIQKVFITGNVGSRDMYNYFRTIASEVYCTRGEYDGAWAANLPDTAVVEIGGLSIGLIHGHQIIPTGDKDSQAMMQRELGVDVLLTGGTHVTKITELDNNLVVNPGSITGALHPAELSVVPSFVVLDIRDRTVTSFTYRYIPDNTGRAADDADDEESKPADDPSGDANIKIKKREWSKE